MLPPSIVEKEGFKRLMKTVKPLYVVPSKKTVSRHLEAKYEKLKTEFIKELDDVPWYCITLDKWSDKCSRSYIGITIHYIDKNTQQMKTKNLGCFPYNERATAVNLEEAIKKIFEDFKIITDKITGIITDGEKGLVKACQNIVGESRHLICKAHEAAKILPDAIAVTPEVKKIVDKIKPIVTLIRRSIPATRALKDLQLKDGKTENNVLKLKQDCPTRFTSTVDMMTSYITLAPYLAAAMDECEHPLDLLTRDEMKTLKDISPMMKAVTSAITVVSADLQPTISLIIPIFNCLTTEINSYLPQTGLGEEFKAQIQLHMSQRFKNLEKIPLLAEATLLDPRFKKLHFNDFEAASKALQKIRQKITGSVENTKDLQNEKPQDKKESSSPTVKSLWDHHVAAQKAIVARPHENSSVRDRIDSEVQTYLQAEFIDIKENPLMYWNNNKHFFENLSPLAVRRLTAVGTSVSSERLFSKAENTTRNRRSKLSGKNLNILMFLGCFSFEDWLY